jgi:hypothetical protein
MNRRTTAEPATFTWGRIGENTWGPIRSRRGGIGVIRAGIPSGFRYVLTPFARELPFPCWMTTDDPKTLVMDLGGSMVAPEPPLHRTLEDLRLAVARYSPRSSQQGVLDELDAVVLALINAAGSLHRLGFGAGLLSPAAVFYTPPEPIASPGSNGSGGAYLPQLILPDVGFIRFRGLVPDWMGPRSPDRWLWPLHPESMMIRSFDPARHPHLKDEVSEGDEPEMRNGFDPTLDLRMLARLIGWILTDAGPIARQRAGSKAEVWEVLAEAEDGRIRTAEAFRARLTEAPPSQHVLDRERSFSGSIARGLPRRLARAIAVGTVVVALGAAGVIGIRAVLLRVQPAPSNAFHEARSSNLGDAIRRLEAELVALRLPEPDSATLSDRAATERDREQFLKDVDTEGQGVLHQLDLTGFADKLLETQTSALRRLHAEGFRLRHGRDPVADDLPEWLRVLLSQVEEVTRSQRPGAFSPGPPR